MSRKRVFATLSASLLLYFSVAAQAHHSYAAYDQEERFELSGTITDVHWANPHILLTVHADGRDIRVEWVTTAGAERTGVAREQFRPGDSIIVIGSRNRNPEVQVMTVIKELLMPAQNWRWVSPSLLSTR